LDHTDNAAQEPLREVQEFGLLGENYYASDRNPPHYGSIDGAIKQLWVREGVAERLARVDGRVAEVGLCLWLFDGWRPTAVQAYFHDFWMPREIRARRPSVTDEAIQHEVDAYWAAPTVDASAPSPHLTGGAVDLTLCWADTKERLWMGSLFDDVSELAHLDRFEGQGLGTLAISDDEARANRRLLYWIMTEEGFCANPSEWWHFSYGDQMWARLTGAKTAFYGSAQPPLKAERRSAAA
jgi:D-alanyl-D-alanine dipeptidase